MGYVFLKQIIDLEAARVEGMEFINVLLYQNPYIIQVSFI